MAVQGNGGCPGDGLTHNCAPGELDLLRRERCPSQHGGQRLGHDLMDRNHGGEDSIDAMPTGRVGTLREDQGQRPRLVLASASPRRAELLQTAGIAFDVIPADIDEGMLRGEPAEEYVRRVARQKAEATARLAPARVVLGADTIVVVDDAVMGKPVDNADARRMLTALSGRTHTVLTAVCLVNPVAPVEQVRSCVARTQVDFVPLSEAEITWYVASGEPADKAGAYAIQGLASRFVSGIQGSYSNVVGLPVSLVYELCREAGLLIS
jgi:septum formation protein